MDTNQQPAQSYYVDEKRNLSLKGIVTGFFKWIFNSIQFFVIGMTLLVVLYLFVLSPHIVDGVSMQPNFCNGDIYFTYKLGGNYTYGDVIAFKHNETNNYIKRVVGIEGDVMKVEDGKVYRNGSLLNEVYLPEGRRSDLFPGDQIMEGVEYVVPQGKYFVMGDNRPESSDSRHFAAIDPSYNTIDGKVVFVAWPLNKMRIFDQNNVYPVDACVR